MDFAIHQHELATGIHVSPHPELPSHHALPPIPLGCYKASALGAFYGTFGGIFWSIPKILQVVFFESK